MANRIKGITIEIDGSTTGLDKSLKAVNQRLKTTQSDLRDVQKLMKFSSGTSELKLWAQQQGLVKEQIQATKEKLSQLKTASEQAAKTRKNYTAWANAMKPVDEAFKKTQEEIEKTRKKMKTLEKAGKVDTKQYKDLQKKMQDLEKESKNLTQEKKRIDKEFGKPISPKEWQRLQREIIETQNNLKRLQSQANPVKKAFETISKAGKALGAGIEKGAAAMQTAGQKITKVSDTIVRKTADVAKATATITGSAVQQIGNATEKAGSALTKGALALDSAIGKAVLETGSFDSTMSQVRAISGANAEEFEALRNKAREMGKATKFSAKEAGQGLTYMAMAGWNTEEMLAALPDVLNLAVAGGEELGTTSDIVTDVMTALGMSADQAGRFADVLATTAANSNTSVSIMGDTFKQSAALAGALGYSIEDVSTAVGLMANAGIKGSKAGTALRNTFNGLISGATLTAEAFGEDPIEWSPIDAETGDMKSLRQTLAEMRSLFSYMTKQERFINAQNIAGMYGFNGFLAMVNSSDADFEALQASINDCNGSAAAMAEIMGDNLTGDTLKLKSAIGELSIQFGDILMPKMREIVQRGTKLVEWIQSLDENTKKSIIRIAGIATVAGPALILIGKLTTGIGGLIMNFGRIGVGGLGAIAAIGGITFALKKLYDSNENVRALVDQYAPQLGSAWDSAASVAKEKLESMGINVDGLVEKVKGVKDRVVTEFQGMWPTIKENMTLAGEAIMETIPIVVDVIKNDVLPLGQKVLKWFNDLSPETKKLIVKIATFGVILSPVASILGRVLSFGGSIMGFLGGGIKLISGIGGALGPVVGLLSTGVGKVLPKLGKGIMSVVKLLPMLISPAGAVIAIIAGIGFAVYELIKHWDEIKKAFSETWENIKEACSAGWEAVKKAFSDAWEAIKKGFSDAWKSVKKSFSDGWKKVKDTASAAWGSIKEGAGNVRDSVAGAFDNLKNRTAAALDTVKAAASERLGRIKDTFEANGGGIKGAWFAAMEGLRIVAEDKFNVINRLTGGKLGEAVQTAKTKFEGLKEAAGTALQNMGTYVDQRFEHVKQTFEANGGGIKGAWAAAMDGINIVTKDATRILDAWTDGKFSEITGKVKEKIRSAIDWIKELPSKALQWGQDMFKSFADGIEKGFEFVKTKITDAGNWIRERLHFSVPDKGPLSDADSWMPDFMRVLAQGISSNAGLVQKAIDSLSASMVITPELATATGPAATMPTNYGTTNNTTTANYYVTINATENQSADDLYDTFNRRLAQDARRLRKGRG